MDSENYFERGKQNCREYFNSQAFAGLTRDIRAEEAIKIFWPPADEQLIQVSMPIPKPRQKWIAGFKKAQKERQQEVSDE